MRPDDHAFPTPLWYDEKQIGVEQGITVRDYFAAAALSGICDDIGVVGRAAQIALEAYQIADAMLKAREL